jgi:hypothetical protein
MQIQNYRGYFFPDFPTFSVPYHSHVTRVYINVSADTASLNIGLHYSVDNNDISSISGKTARKKILFTTDFQA